MNAKMINATNYELAIRERDEALAKLALLEAQQAPIQSAELAELRKLAEAATPGMWEALPHGRIVGGPLRHYVNGSAKGQIASCSVTFHDQAPDDEPERQQANADFIAAVSPAAVLRLLDALAAAPAQQQASTVPAGWRAVIDQARDSICAGGLAENRQHERSIVEPHLDGVYDALDALEKEVAPAHALTDAEIERITETDFYNAANTKTMDARCKCFARAIAAHLARKG